MKTTIMASLITLLSFSNASHAGEIIEDYENNQIRWSHGLCKEFNREGRYLRTLKDYYCEGSNYTMWNKGRCKEYNAGGKYLRTIEDSACY